MKATIPASPPVGHWHSTELWTKQGWKGAAEGKPGPAEDFSLQALTRGRSRVPSVRLSRWWGQGLEAEKAQTYSWCEPGKGLPEERAGCQNSSPCLKQGAVRSPGLTGQMELLSCVPLPCTSRTGSPSTLCLGFQHQQSLPMEQGGGTAPHVASPLFPQESWGLL